MNLSILPIADGFPLRGQQVTRLETFVDAALAFSLTFASCGRVELAKT